MIREKLRDALLDGSELTETELAERVGCHAATVHKELRKNSAWFQVRQARRIHPNHRTAVNPRYQVRGYLVNLWSLRPETKEEFTPSPRLMSAVAISAQLDRIAYLRTAIRCLVAANQPLLAKAAGEAYLSESAALGWLCGRTETPTSVQDAP